MRHVRAHKPGDGAHRRHQQGLASRIFSHEPSGHLDGGALAHSLIDLVHFRLSRPVEQRHVVVELVWVPRAARCVQRASRRVVEEDAQIVGGLSASGVDRTRFLAARLLRGRPLRGALCGCLQRAKQRLEQLSHVAFLRVAVFVLPATTRRLERYVSRVDGEAACGRIGGDTEEKAAGEHRSQHCKDGVALPAGRQVEELSLRLAPLGRREVEEEHDGSRAGRITLAVDGAVPHSTHRRPT